MGGAEKNFFGGVKNFFGGEFAGVQAREIKSVLKLNQARLQKNNGGRRPASFLGGSKIFIFGKFLGRGSKIFFVLASRANLKRVKKNRF